MDISVSAMVSGAMQMQQARVAQDVQVTMLKKAQDIQTTQAAALLQTLPGNLPLATQGTLGTQLNVMA
ncbi:MAG: YjfB family protein [Macromonas sp.]